MKKILFIPFFIFSSVFSTSYLFSNVDIRMGVSANFSITDVVKASTHTSSSYMGNPPTEEDLDLLRKRANTALAGIQYNIYAQAGYNWDIFEIGGEFSFGWNAFSDVNNKNSWSSLMGFSPRAYFAFDLFLVRLTLLTGMTFNVQVGDAPLVDSYKAPKVDIGMRIGIGPLFTEFLGGINIKEGDLSVFKIGLGLEFLLWSN